MKATKNEIESRYVPALISLSKQEKITGKIAFNCGRTIGIMDKALKGIEKSRIMILESRAKKDDKGVAMTIPSLKQDGVNEDNTPKMVEQIGQNGQTVMEYVFEGDDKIEAIKAIKELEDMEVEMSILTIPASEIMSMKEMKDGGVLIFQLGEIIDDTK